MTIRLMTAADHDAVLEMMRVFYASPAVLSNGSEEIFENDINACTGENPFLEGYVFVADSAGAAGDSGNAAGDVSSAGGGSILGYAMVAKAFSTEFGKPCMWIEDLYVKPEFRNLGIGAAFFRFIEETYAGSLFRLEVEYDNEKAVRFYERNGYRELPYMEMKK